MNTRKPMIAGNWKLHKTLNESLELVAALSDSLSDVEDRDIVVAPVFTALASVIERLSDGKITVAAQNCYPEKTGAFTGEVSAFLLRDLGCRHVIIGHSERRQLFSESGEFLNRKVQAALEAGLGVIFCIGETLEERESGQMFDILSRQLEEGLQGVSTEQMAEVVVAYEPVWAIGTGKTATDNQAQEVHAFIRGLLTRTYGSTVADQTRILYGGSVKPDNIDGLMRQPDVDGALVGGASLKADDFTRIVRFNQI